MFLVLMPFVLITVFVIRLVGIVYVDHLGVVLFVMKDYVFITALILTVLVITKLENVSVVLKELRHIPELIVHWLLALESVSITEHVIFSLGLVLVQLVSPDLLVL
jgi:hypothetical protein